MLNPSAPAAPVLNPLGIFNYCSLSTLLIYWKVPPAVTRPLLAGTGLLPGIFDGQALVNLNFERYAGLGNNYFTTVIETEFNVVVYPAAGVSVLPQLSVDSFLSGNDQTKIYGNFRVNVPCTDPIAVQAGSRQYGEIKFLTTYNYNVPSINSPAVLDWWIRCMDPIAPAGASTPFIFDLHANFQGARPQPSSFSPIPDYANLVQNGVKYMILSARNIYGVFQRWTPGPDTVQLKIGGSPHPMTGQMRAVFANAEPAGILFFEAPPAASSGHAQLMIPIPEEGQS